MHDLRSGRMPRDQLHHGFVDERTKGLLAGLMAADHFLLSRLNDARVLRPFAAGKKGGTARAGQNETDEFTSLHKSPILGNNHNGHGAFARCDALWFKENIGGQAIQAADSSNRASDGKTQFSLAAS